MTDNPYGCDPAAVTLANWRARPHSQWAFQNVAMLVPSAPITGGGGGELPGEPTLSLADVPVGPHGMAAPEFLAACEADELLVVKRGQVAARWRAPYRVASRPHIAFSISKSITGVIAGIMADYGVLDVEKTIAHYVPAAAHSGYGDCSVRNLLDMRVSLNFSEEYLNEDGDYARYRRAMLWNPAPPGYDVEPLAEMLQSLKKGEGEHGGVFRYLSPNSDMLGLVLEAITGAKFADLVSELLWQPLGCGDAQLTVDGVGGPRTAGGISTYTDDLARLGLMLMAGGEGIVSEAWVADMKAAGDRAAWAASDFADFIPGGRYRGQWYQFPAPSQAFMAVGIHGQWLYADPERDVVIVMLSSQAEPQNDEKDVIAINFLKQIAAIA
ncbi:MAG: serine hydrolase domain-containing protein [Pikeienuella sp.]